MYRLLSVTKMIENSGLRHFKAYRLSVNEMMPPPNIMAKETPMTSCNTKVFFLFNLICKGNSRPGT